MPKRKVRVEVRFVPTAAGGRRTAVNLAGGYRTILVMGTYTTSPPPSMSEAEAEQRGIFGIELNDGPSEVFPGETAIATLSVLVWDAGYSFLKQEREFTLIEGPHVVAHGRVLGEVDGAV